MASKILAPALIAVPRIPAQLPPSRKLKLSSCPAVNSNYRVSLASGVSWGLIGPNLDAVTAAFARQSFVARAEQEVGGGEVVEGGGEAGGLAEESETVMEEGAVAVLEGEEVKVEDATKAPRNRKPRIKLGEIMGILNKRAVEASEKERPIPDIRTGDIVQIKLEVPENRRRLSIYKGIVMSRQNAGIHTTIRIRRIIAGIGVEIVFPLYSPNIKEIKVVNHRKVRRARLYYLRDKLPRFSTFK